MSTSRRSRSTKMYEKSESVMKAVGEGVGTVVGTVGLWLGAGVGTIVGTEVGVHENSSAQHRTTAVALVSW